MTQNKTDKKLKIDYTAYLRSQRPKPLVYFVDELVITGHR